MATVNVALFTSSSNVQEAIDDFVLKVIGSTAKNILGNLTAEAQPKGTGTPVDTYHALSNWVIDLRDPPRDTKIGSKKRVDFSEQLSSYDLAEQVVFGNPVSIVNNVPYIVDLNEGSSRQTGKGFVQRAIKKAILVDVPNEMETFGG
jgi:hypothetical protein